MPKPAPRLVAAGVTLRKQVDLKWPKRDRSTDGWLGDKAHQARQSDHNPDPFGWVHALDIDADLTKLNGRDVAFTLADQLRMYCADRAAGYERVKYIVYRNKICSGTYAKTRWTWRGNNYGHMTHIHISFTNHAQRKSQTFLLPILMN